MKIGVIGGNGVAATNRLCDMIERKVTAAGAFRDAHHPEMIVWQATSVPSRSMFLEGRGPDWRPDYIRIARQLKQLGCDICCMCCNTAHYAIDEIERESGLNFINILEGVAKEAVSMGLDKCELLCSDGARKFDIYGSVFRQVCPDIKIVYPDEDRQRLVTKAICAVKTSARLGVDARSSPVAIIGEIIKHASAPVILGCTDLRVAFGPNELLPDVICIDSLECLANTIVALHQENRND